MDISEVDHGIQRGKTNRQEAYPSIVNICGASPMFSASALSYEKHSFTTSVESKI